MTYLGPQQLIDPTKVKVNSDACYEILAFDPGGVTGWSYIAFPKVLIEARIEELLENKAAWFHGQIDCNPIDPGAKEMRDLCTAWPNAVVVCESFFVRQMAVDLTPCELIAVLRHHLWMKGRKLHMQQASMAKRLDNKRLKLMNVYTKTGGLEHARDADRHALMTIRRCMDTNGKKFRKKLWSNENH